MCLHSLIRTALQLLQFFTFCCLISTRRNIPAESLKQSISLPSFDHPRLGLWMFMVISMGPFGDKCQGFLHLETNPLIIMIFTDESFICWWLNYQFCWEKSTISIIFYSLKSPFLLADLHFPLETPQIFAVSQVLCQSWTTPIGISRLRCNLGGEVMKQWRLSWIYFNEVNF